MKTGKLFVIMLVVLFAGQGLVFALNQPDESAPKVEKVGDKFPGKGPGKIASGQTLEVAQVTALRFKNNDIAGAVSALEAHYNEGTLARYLESLAGLGVIQEQISNALKKSPLLAKVADSTDPLDFIPEGRVITTTGEIITQQMDAQQRRDLINISARDTLSIVVRDKKEETDVIASFENPDAVKEMIAQRSVIITVVANGTLYNTIQEDVLQYGASVRMDKLAPSVKAVIRKG